MREKKLIFCLGGISIALWLASIVAAPIGFDPPLACELLFGAASVSYGMGLGILISNRNRR
jgi:hypothetical protein